MITVIDLNEIEENETFETMQDFRVWAENMLSDYYEVRSDYGDPIAALLPYIPNIELIELVKTYSYKVVTD